MLGWLLFVCFYFSVCLFVWFGVLVLQKVGPSFRITHFIIIILIFVFSGLTCPQRKSDNRHCLAEVAARTCCDVMSDDQKQLEEGTLKDRGISRDLSDNDIESHGKHYVNTSM